MSLSLQERAASYARTFPDWPAPRIDDRWLDGMWVLGNAYRNASRLYGAYPRNYLRRIMALFPDARRVLHLFSGSLTPEQLSEFPGKHERLDISPAHAPDILMDAEDLHQLTEFSDFVPYDLILADPPYSVEDAEHYGTCMIKRNKVFAGAATVLRIGGNLVWLDQVLPMFRKIELHLWGLIGVVRSTNHRFRVASMFERVA